MNEIIREIEADIKSEKLAVIMQKYGNAAVMCAIIIVLAVTTSSFYKSYQKSTGEKNGNSYAAAQKLIAEGKAEEGKKAMLALSSDKSGYGIIAGSALIKDDFDANKMEDAKTKLLSASKGTHPEINELIKSALALAGNANQAPENAIELEAGVAKLISEGKLAEAYKLIETSNSIAADNRIKMLRQYIIARTTIEGDKKDAPTKN